MSICIFSEKPLMKMLKNKLLLEAKVMTDDPEQGTSVVTDDRVISHPKATWKFSHPMVPLMFSSFMLEPSRNERADFYVVKRYHHKSGFTQQTFVFSSAFGLIQPDESSRHLAGSGGRYMREPKFDALFSKPLDSYLEAMNFTGRVVIGISKDDHKVVCVRTDLPDWGMMLMLEGAASHKGKFLEDSYNFRLYESWVVGLTLFRNDWPWRDYTKDITCVEAVPFGARRFWPVDEMKHGVMNTKSNFIGVVTAFGGTLKETCYHAQRACEGIKCTGLQWRGIEKDMQERSGLIEDYLAKG